MSKINDGGPAFPHPNPDYAQDYGRRDRTPPFGGMSLRDWFAGQAIPALISSVGIAKVAEQRGVTVSELVARAAYQYADAMLKAREGGTP